MLDNKKAIQDRVLRTVNQEKEFNASKDVRKKKGIKQNTPNKKKKKKAKVTKNSFIDEELVLILHNTYSTPSSYTGFKTKKTECELKKHALKVRKGQLKNPTQWESKMLDVFGDINGLEFEFQKPIIIIPYNFFVVDFFFNKYNLVVELDGCFHFNKKQSEKDVDRSMLLGFFGIKVIRFNNSEVVKDYSCVVNSVLSTISDIITANSL